MVCPNCRNQIFAQVSNCPTCGIELAKVNNMNAQQKQTTFQQYQAPKQYQQYQNTQQLQQNIAQQKQMQSQNQQYSFAQFDNNNVQQTKGIKKRRKLPAFFIITILITIAMVAYLFATRFFDNRNNQRTSSEELEEVQEIKQNSLQKLRADYKDGSINVNEYFTQLVCLEFDSEKLNPKYESDYESNITSCELDTIDIIEKYGNQLDENVLKFYLTNATMSNVVLGEKPSGSTKRLNESNGNYEIKKLTNFDLNYKTTKIDNEQEIAANHYLNKAHLSSNGNFIIWYADDGRDKITKEQAEAIVEELETTVKEYERLFGVQYAYDPYMNLGVNGETILGLAVLKECNIEVSALEKAMSIYIYDTGSSRVSATYIDHGNGTKFFDKWVWGGLGSDGIMNYPYIRINKKTFVGNDENALQVTNHELFHHIQRVYCDGNEGCGGVFSEGMANFASAMVTDVNRTNNFLNTWAGIYTRQTSTKLMDIADPGDTKGYAIFPYFYSYSEKVNNWSNILMEAHKESEPFEYIQRNASTEDLKEAMNDLAYRTISQSYNQKSFVSNVGVEKTKVLQTDKIGKVINEGAIDYFELEPMSVVKATAAGDYLTFNVYGRKQGKYEKIDSESKELEIDTTLYYGPYEKVYLSVTNADLMAIYYYEITSTESQTKEENNKQQEQRQSSSEEIKNIEQIKYETAFANYNIDMTMKINFAGIETISQMQGVVDEAHQKEYFDVKTIVMGFPVTTKMYHDFTTGISYVSQPFSSTWMKSKDNPQKIDLAAILNKLIKMENVTKISDNHYKVKMSKNEIEGLMGTSDVDASIIKGDVSVDVYTDNTRIVKLEYDFGELMQGYQEFSAVINFSNYNNAGDVIIPQEVINDAISE